MNKNFSKVVIINLEESVIAALAKLAPDASLPVAGKLVPSKDLQAHLQAHVDTLNAVKDARAKFSQLVARERTQRPEVGPELAGIRNHAAALYGELSPEFASFGFTPRKAPQRTVESKAGAAAKLRATRVARHTMGKRQRAAIHGAAPTNAPSNGAADAVSMNSTPVAAVPAPPSPVLAPSATPAAAAVSSGASGVPTNSSATNGAPH